MGCELYVGQSALQAGPSPRGRKDRRYLADPGRRSEARGRPYLERKVYRREPATPEIPEKMRSPLLHSASLCTPAASRSGRWLCDRDEALRCYIRRRAGCLCDPELRSAALSCLWGYHVRPWDQTASCDTLPLSYRSAEGGGRRGVSGPPDKLPVIAWFLESFTVATLTGVKVAPAVWTNTVITHSLFTPFRCRIGLNRSRSPLAR